MSKVTFIIKASKETVSENAANVLVTIAKRNFITSAEVRQELEDKVAGAAVNSNIGVLIKKGLVEKSGDGLVITADATDLLNEAAALYAAEHKPELVKERATRKPRGTTEEMKTYIDYIETKVKTQLELEVLKIEENRSNLGVVLAKRTATGLRKFEVMNKGIFRIFGYKVEAELLNTLEGMGMEYREGAGGNTYIDIALTTENIDKVFALGIAGLVNKL